MHTHTPHSHCAHTALATAKQVCAERGVRFTEQRQHVLELIWKQHKPIKAYDLLDKLKALDPSAKPPTIYRSLDFLLEQGLIHRISTINAFVGCHHAGAHEHCFFMLCNRCGEIEECCTPALKQALLDAAQHERFTPHTIHVEIEGICADCKTKEAA